MQNYKVTFRWHDTDTFCANVCKAENEEKARKYYNTRYRDVTVQPMNDGELEVAKRKGMPVTVLF